MGATYDLSEITQKVKKLLALAERGGTEAEAIAAAAKAQELVERHNLSLGEIGLEDEGAIEVDSTPRTRIPPHAVSVARAACKLFDCDFYYHAISKEGLSWRWSMNRSFRFVGTRVSVEACLLTFNYLMASIESLLAGSDLKVVSTDRGRVAYRAYRLGCAKRLLQMATELKQARIEHGSAEAQALVLVAQRIAKHHIESLKLKGGHGTDDRIGYGTTEAFEKGFNDGARIDIHAARTNRMLK